MFRKRELLPCVIYQGLTGAACALAAQCQPHRGRSCNTAQPPSSKSRQARFAHGLVDAAGRSPGSCTGQSRAGRCGCLKLVSGTSLANLGTTVLALFPIVACLCMLVL